MKTVLEEFKIYLGRQILTADSNINGTQVGSGDICTRQKNKDWCVKEIKWGELLGKWTFQLPLKEYVGICLANFCDNQGLHNYKIKGKIIENKAIYPIVIW